MLKKYYRVLIKMKKIIFAPDRNLGNYLNNELGVNMLLYGMEHVMCMIH